MALGQHITTSRILFERRSGPTTFRLPKKLWRKHISTKYAKQRHIFLELGIIKNLTRPIDESRSWRSPNWWQTWQLNHRSPWIKGAECVTLKWVTQVSLIDSKINRGFKLLIYDEVLNNKWLGGRTLERSENLGSSCVRLTLPVTESGNISPSSRTLFSLSWNCGT
jgi:hypothetical protein